MLPSKYAPGGISVEDSHKTISVGRKIKKPTEYIIKTIERKVDEALKHDSEDIEMVPIDNDFEVDIISDYVNSSRLWEHELDDSYMELDYEEIVIESNYSYLVIDTNFVLSNLRLLDDIVKLADRYKLKVIVPVTVMRELDGLKKSTRVSDAHEPQLKGRTIGHLARWANDWLYNELAQGSIVKGQKLSQKLDKSTMADDAILDCCIFFKHTYRKNLIVLCSNDRNLCLKALANDILTVSFQKGMTAELIAETIYNESAVLGNVTARSATISGSSNDPKITNNGSRSSNIGSRTISNPLATVYNEIFTLTKSSIHHVMKDTYGEDLILTNYDPNDIDDLSDCKRTIERFWATCFSEYLSRSFKTISTNMPFSKQEAQTFIEEWQAVLIPIYHRLLDEQQTQALFQLIDRWNELVET